METMDNAGWKAAGDAVTDYMASHGIGKKALSQKADIDPSTLWKIRAGDPTVSEASRNKVEAAIGWPAGLLAKIAAREVDAPPVSTEDQIAELRRDVASLRESVEAMADQLATRRPKRPRRQP